jgi:mono/diheme cytochrome c family protein
VALSAQAWLMVAATAPANGGRSAARRTHVPRYCAGCHGADGRGWGKNFMPHVGALTRKGYTDLLEDSYFEAIIAEGGEAFGKSSYMPAWKTTLSSRTLPT